MSQALDRALPDYAWAADRPLTVGVARGAWSHNLPPVAVTPPPDGLPPAPVETSQELVTVADPRIRTLAPYWHERWPFAVPACWLRPEAADRLSQVAAGLPDGFGLAIWDGWRDPRLQAVLHDTVYTDRTLPPGFVAYPDADPARCPPHATGGTVDLTLTWRHRPLALGTGFDAFVPDAAAGALEADGDELERDLRRLLAAALTEGGFVGHPQEWWHWEYGTRMWAAVTGNPVRFGPAHPPGDP
jgi:D-alanyl-D-alanine dipeptidase